MHSASLNGGAVITDFGEAMGLGLGKCSLLVLVMLCTAGLVLTEEADDTGGDPLESPDCGRRPLVSEPIARIVGGVDARPGAWPWQVSLEYYVVFKGFQHACGGSVIDHNWVITAAHCFRKRRYPASWRAIVGLQATNQYAESTTLHEISKIFVRYNFNFEKMTNDIALVKVSTPILYTDYIQPVCIPNDMKARTNIPCFITGWGKTSDGGKPSEILQQAQVDIISNEECNKPAGYNGILNEDMICAGFLAGKVDACQGDSGGPFSCFFPELKRFHLMGITSFGLGCAAPNRPGIYTHVAHFRDWVEDVIVKNNKNPIGLFLPLIFLTVGKEILS